MLVLLKMVVDFLVSAVVSYGETPDGLAKLEALVLELEKDLGATPPTQAETTPSGATSATASEVAKARTLLARVVSQ